MKRNSIKLPEVEIKEVTVIGHLTITTSKSDFLKYERLVYNIKRVYPYALVVRVKLNQVNEALKNIPDGRDRKEYMKNVEKDVFADYEGDMR